MGTIKEALTFDDVTLAPKYSEILPSEVDTKTNLSKNYNKNNFRIFLAYYNKKIRLIDNY